MSELKTQPLAHRIDEQLLTRIPLTLAGLMVALLFVLGMVTASNRTLDKQAISIKTPQFLVNINTDSSGELMLLPGVGKTIASRIITHRQQHGLFTSINQLNAISGISHRTVARLKPFLLSLPDDVPK